MGAFPNAHHHSPLRILDNGSNADPDDRRPWRHGSAFIDVVVNVALSGGVVFLVFLCVCCGGFYLQRF